jgi:hypothetical protein
MDSTCYVLWGTLKQVDIDHWGRPTLFLIVCQHSGDWNVVPPGETFTYDEFGQSTEIYGGRDGVVMPISEEQRHTPYTGTVEAVAEAKALYHEVVAGCMAHVADPAAPLASRELLHNPGARAVADGSDCDEMEAARIAKANPILEPAVEETMDAGSHHELDAAAQSQPMELAAEESMDADSHHDLDAAAQSQPMAPVLAQWRSRRA